MAKLTLSDLVTLENQTSAINTVNANSALIETALENTLSRDGTSPNAMGAALDMNGQRILNLPTPSANTDVVRLQDLTLTYLSNTTLATTPTGSDGNKVLKVNNGGTAYTFSGITIDASNVMTIPASGGLTLANGNIVQTVGNNTLTSGNLTLSNGNITMASGTFTITSGSAILSSGNLTLTSGNLVLTNGNVTHTAGNHTLSNGYFDVKEIAAPSSPAADTMRIYVKDNAGATDLYVKDSTGLETRLDIPNATATEMEAASSTAHYVTPGIFHRHPASPKAWAKVTGGTTPSLAASYGVASVSRPGLGRLTVTLSTAMSSANYCIQVQAERNSTALTVANVITTAIRNAAQTTTTFEVECYDDTATTHIAIDPASWHITVWGDQ